jgi:hypothetical protein
VELASPSSAVAVLRERGEPVDYLVLCDSPIVLQRTDGTLTPVDDDRTDHLPGGRPYSLEPVRASRNRLGGFWVASTAPEREGVRGSRTFGAKRGNRDPPSIDP